MPPLLRNIDLSNQVEAQIHILRNPENDGELHTLDLYIDSFSGESEEDAPETESST